MLNLTETSQEIDLADRFAAALDWWRDAGVDSEFTDDPQDWLAGDAPVAPARPVERVEEEIAEAQALPAIARSDLPSDLQEFTEWWMSPDSPLPHSPNPRIAPRGKSGAALMLVAPMPESEDRETLLSGPQGRLVANLCNALGVNPTETYVASALPANLTLPDWNALVRDGLGHALAHHIDLVKPHRVVLFGSKLPMLLGHSDTAPIEGFSAVDGIATLSTFAPDRLLDHPRQRARLWQRLLTWTSQ